MVLGDKNILQNANQNQVNGSNNHIKDGNNTLSNLTNIKLWDFEKVDDKLFWKGIGYWRNLSDVMNIQKFKHLSLTIEDNRLKVSRIK